MEEYAENPQETTKDEEREGSRRWNQKKKDFRQTLMLKLHLSELTEEKGSAGYLSGAVKGKMANHQVQDFQGNRSS